MSKKYNGWANYETWCVNLWLDNEPGTQSYWGEQAEMAVAQAEGDKEKASFSLAKEMKDEISENWHDICDANGLGASMFTDLMRAAIDTVDWGEIARHWCEDAEWDAPAEDVTADEECE